MNGAVRIREVYPELVRADPWLSIRSERFAGPTRTPLSSCQIRSCTHPSLVRSSVVRLVWYPSSGTRSSFLRPSPCHSTPGPGAGCCHGLGRDCRRLRGSSSAGRCSPAADSALSSESRSASQWETQPAPVVAVGAAAQSAVTHSTASRRTVAPLRHLDMLPAHTAVEGRL